jgi:hypothetical protein
LSARVVVVVVVAVVALLAPDADARRGRAKVVRATAERAWLDAGTKDGLAAGDEVNLRRRRRRAGKCIVEHASASWSTCRGDVDARATRARFDARVVPDDPSDAEPERLPTADALQARRAALGQARFAKVAYTAQARARARGWRFPLSVSFVHRSWARAPFDRRTFHRERVEVVLRGARVFIPSLQLHADAVIEGALASPVDARYRRRDPVRVELRETALSWRPHEGGLVGTVGRFIPWNVPGVTILDGVQAGWRSSGGALEVGAYAGTHPELTADLPSLLRTSAGAYWGARWLGESAFVAHRGRLGVRTSPTLALRTELEVDADAALGSWLRASVGARAGLLGDRGARPGLDLAFARARLEVPGELYLGGGYRWSAPTALEVDGLPLLALPRAGRHHADALAGFGGLGFVDLALAGGGAVDVVTGAVRAWVGPDVTLPRALLGLGGLSLSYREELGDVAGRAAWGRVWVDGLERTRLSSTTMVFEDASPIEASRELLVSGRGDFGLLRWLSVGASARTQLALPSLQERAVAHLPVVVAELSVTGSL